jgi:hypothetical protein
MGSSEPDEGSIKRVPVSGLCIPASKLPDHCLFDVFLLSETASFNCDTFILPIDIFIRALKGFSIPESGLEVPFVSGFLNMKQSTSASTGALKYCERTVKLMKTSFLCICTAVVMIALIAAPVDAHAEGVSLSAYTSTPPVIDGTMSPGEWDAADTIHFVSTDLAIAHTLYVMNDMNNLYLAVLREDTTPATAADWVTFVFDNNNNGVIETGDDLISAMLALGMPVFSDAFYSGAIPVSDEGWQYEGTVDGSAAVGAQGAYTLFEISHPLASGDYGFVDWQQTTEGPHDFNLNFGDTVGFNIETYDSSFDLGDWPVHHPPVWDFNWAMGFGDIIIAPPPSVSENLGCTPGFWKHPDIHPWPSYAPEPDDSMFVGDLNGDGDPDTYLDSLQYKGGNGIDGARRILLRASTAAYLNEIAFGEDYTCYNDWSDLFSDAYYHGDRHAMIDAAAQIDECNNSICEKDKIGNFLPPVR